MDLSKLLLAELRKSRPDLVEEIVREVEAAAAAKAKAETADAVKSLREDVSAKIAEMMKPLNATIDGLKAELAESRKQQDAAEVRARIAAKAALIERLVKESGLPKEALTPLFLENLNGITEREVVDEKGNKRVVSVEERVKAEIEERRKLIQPEKATIRGAGGPVVSDEEKPVTEDECQFIADRDVFEIAEAQGKTLKQYRAERDAAKKGGSAA